MGRARRGGKIMEPVKLTSMAGAAPGPSRAGAKRKNAVRFQLYGEEIVEKQVTASGKSGRVYLPMEWLGKRVKIIRMN